MRIQYRGLSIELAQDDPRIGQIESLLFGLTSGASPRAAVPPQIALFWQRMQPASRKLLTLLAEREHTPLELEQALGVDHERLRARHGAIARSARSVGLATPIGQKGRGRARRRFFLQGPVLEWMPRLAQGE